MFKKIIPLFLLFFVVYAQAGPFRYVVAADGSGDFTSIQAALDSCPENQASMIFIKNGVYDEQVTLGSKTTASTKKISLIGENPDSVIITHSQSRAASGSPTFEDVCTVKLYASDFYAENITIQNTAGNTGMAEALYTAGDRETFKNCHILGYQDTYRSKKSTRGYFKDCLIQGAVDFIYAGGIEFFDDCQINCVKGGGYITAPEDAYVTIPKMYTVCGKFLRIGFIFRNCTITADKDVSDSTFYLGRPWNDYAGTFYLNCKMGPQIKPIGWEAWGGRELTSSFAEYNSMDLNGNPIDTTKRASWSFQLPKADVDSLLGLKSIYARASTTLFNPIPLCVAPQLPTNFLQKGNELSWTPVDSVAGYIIYKDGRYLTSVSGNSYTDQSGTTGVYTIRSVSTNGALSDVAGAVTAVNAPQQKKIFLGQKGAYLTFNEKVNVQVYALNGDKLINSVSSSSVYIGNLTTGCYVLKVKTREGQRLVKKIMISMS